MTKILVETTGAFMLMNSNGEEVPHNRPAVIENGSFVQNQVVLGQLTVLAAELPREASDAEFAKHWAESAGDRDLAVASFLSMSNAPEAEAPVPMKPSKKK